MTKHIALAAALMLSACQIEGETAADLSADQLAPPGNTPAFVVSQAIPGDTVTFTWAGLPANATVRILGSADGVGTGACPSVLGGACYGIAGTPFTIGQVQANADGVATITRTLPASAPNFTPYAFQGVAYARGVGFLLSNTFERSTGPGFCTFIFDPVCGYDGTTYDNECIAHTVGQPVEAWGFCP